MERWEGFGEEGEGGKGRGGERGGWGEEGEGGERGGWGRKGWGGKRKVRVGREGVERGKGWGEKCVRKN